MLVLTGVLKALLMQAKAESAEAMETQLDGSWFGKAAALLLIDCLVLAAGQPKLEMELEGRRARLIGDRLKKAADN